MLSETQGKQGDAYGVSLFPCRAATPKKSASDGGVHRDALAVYLDPVDADAAAGLLRGAERHAAHMALHRHAAAEQRRKAANVARQLADGLHRQVGREIVKKLVYTAPPIS